MKTPERETSERGTFHFTVNEFVVNPFNEQALAYMEAKGWIFEAAISQSAEETVVVFRRRK